MKGRLLYSATAIVLCFSLHHMISEERFYSLTSSMNMTTPEHDLWKQEAGNYKSSHEKPPLMHCDCSPYRYDLCHLNGPTLMYPSNSSFLVVLAHSAQNTTPPPHLFPHKIRPYPRKWESNIMAHIKELSLSVTVSDAGTAAAGEVCQFYHEAPALVFSTGGYTGNFYHDFADGFVPLFVTSRTLFRAEPVLVVSDCRNWWLSRYADLLRVFTRRPVINLDTETDVHCFDSVTLGLISHGDMSIDPTKMPNSESFRDFHALVHRAYSSGGGAAAAAPLRRRPRLVVVSRMNSVGRVIVNQEEVIRAAEEVGFEVRVFSPKPTTMLSEAYGLINSSHAMMGVHGAALTHMFFLRPGAVLVQVVALGLDWAADVCFGRPAPEMGLEYMEYKITVEESTLVDKYGRDDLVLRNPRAVVKKGWNYTDLYLKEQDVRLDLARIRVFLNRAYKKAEKLFLQEEAAWKTMM